MSSCLKISDLSYSYPLGGEIFDGVDLSIDKGEFVILLGENGSGKSTLVNLLLGLRTPKSGSISVAGFDPQKDSINVRKNMFFASHSIILDENSSIDFILSNYALMYSDYDIEKEQRLLTIFNLSRDQHIFQLSLGQKNRVQIIAAVASNVPFLLIDEVTAVLDPLARKQLAKVLVEEKKLGRAILMATNIPDDSEIDADRILKVESKKLVKYE